MSSGPTLSGNNNGFYPQTTHQFGDSGTEFFETEPPFAPTTFTNPEAGEVPNPENGQGWYYLRDGSPFVDAGTDAIDSSLKNDLARMTTSAPPEFFTEDINSSQTLGPVAIRDSNALDLGWHYPAVDYVLNGATVNNCTLNIDQGTVLALIGSPWQWGLRVNAGGRLNVNGVPTNRVVFAHLEAVQESPIGYFAAQGAMLTFRDVFFGNHDVPATPLPEGRILYADFPTLSGGFNAHLGTLWQNAPGNFTIQDCATYSCIARLGVVGCLFQGGGFFYEDGGPAGRSFGITNTIFDRCTVELANTGGYASYTHLTAAGAQITAANNLFHGCTFILSPVQGSDSWTFMDNILDCVYFAYTGPVANNHHNAYVHMSGDHLTPAPNPSSDRDLLSLEYQTGPLGRFYLPQGATALINQGSRTAGAAGLYHFTTSVATGSSAKEGSSQVDIGPHYLAVSPSGGALGSNSDGIPDFLADRNGDGSESGEDPWQSQNAGSLAVLSPAANAVVSGVVTIHVRLGADANEIELLGASIDTLNTGGSISVADPAGSSASIQLDTRGFPDGSYTLTVHAQVRTADGPPTLVSSEAVPLQFENSLRFAGWEKQIGAALTVDAEFPTAVPSSTLYFFNSSSPKDIDPLSYDLICSRSFQGPGGRISFTEDLANLGISAGDVDPVLYPFIEVAGAFSPTPSLKSSPAYPTTGKWVVAYDMDAADYWYRSVDNMKDPIDGRNGLIPGESRFPTWYHDEVAGHLGTISAGNMGWLSCGTASGTYPLFRDASGQNPAGTRGQTFPKRNAQPPDVELLLDYLKLASAKNFYGNGHGYYQPCSFMHIPANAFQGKELDRYRFVFLDGCYTAANKALLQAFGTASFEFRESDQPGYTPLTIADYRNYSINKNKLRPAAFIAWWSEVPLAYQLPSQEDGCEFKHFTSRCNWHSQLIYWWRDQNRTISEAVGLANAVASQTFEASEENKGWTKSPVWVPGGVLQVLFNPQTHIRIYGCSELKFNEYNTSAEQWPPQ